jgi:TonB family protein
MYNCVDYTILGLRTTRKESTIRKRTLQGLLLSLLLHLLILLIFVKNFKEMTFLPPHSQQEKKISLNLQQIVTPVAKPKVTPPKPKPKPIPVPVPVPQPVKKEPIKEVVTPAPVPIAKKKLLDEKKRLFAEKKENEENNVTKETVKKEKIRKKERKKRVVKRTKPKKVHKRKKRSKDSLANALMGSGTSMFPASRPSSSRRSSSGTYGARMIRKLYGKEFDTFSSTQKKFIKNNLGTIHRITQRTLTQNGYPEIAVRMRQQGTNIVSFYLHPNGDITNLRLKSRIGYAALDENTLEVIRIAYKNYPLPNKKTKIIFYVQYSIY